MQLIEVDVLLDVPSDRTAGVVEELQRAGLREPRLLATIGVVRGRVEPTGIAALAAVPGVRSVRQARLVYAATRSG